MAWIEPLAPRDTDTGSSRVHDATWRAIPCATVFGFQKTNAEGKRSARGRGEREIERKKSEFDPRV